MAQESGLPEGWAEVTEVRPPQTCTGCGTPGHKKGWRPKTGEKTTGAFFGDCCGGWVAESGKETRSRGATTRRKR